MLAAALSLLLVTWVLSAHRLLQAMRSATPARIALAVDARTQQVAA